jgi:hypothetical protein
MISQYGCPFVVLLVCYCDDEAMPLSWMSVWLHRCRHNQLQDETNIGPEQEHQALSVSCLALPDRKADANGGGRNSFPAER